MCLERISNYDGSTFRVALTAYLLQEEPTHDQGNSQESCADEVWRSVREFQEKPYFAEEIGV